MIAGRFAGTECLALMCSQVSWSTKDAHVVHKYDTVKFDIRLLSLTSWACLPKQLSMVCNTGTTINWSIIFLKLYRKTHWNDRTENVQEKIQTLLCTLNFGPLEGYHQVAIFKANEGHITAALRRQITNPATDPQVEGETQPAVRWHWYGACWLTRQQGTRSRDQHKPSSN